MPGMVAGVLVARPVHDAAEPVEQRLPGRAAVVAGVVGVVVDPVLEGVDGRDPGQDQDDAFEQLAVGPVGVGIVVKRVEAAGARAVPCVIEATSQNSSGLSR